MLEMKKIFILFALLTSCVTLTDGERFLGAAKQKQRVNFLQKKLDAAEIEKNDMEERIVQMQEELWATELEVVKRQVDKGMRRIPKNADVAALFWEERETLYRLTRNASPSVAFEAEVELDRILRLITELSDR